MIQTSEHDPADVIAACLAPGEQLLWAGRPKQGFALRGWDIVNIPFSLIMVVAGTMLIFVEIRQPTDPMALPFLLVWTVSAYWIAFGRFFYDARKRSRTYYALTDSRVIVLSGNRSTNIRSMQLRTLKEITITKRADEAGTIEFDRPGFLSYRYRFESSRGMDMPWFSMDSVRSMAFEMISDVRRVYDLIVQAQHQAQQNP